MYTGEPAPANHKLKYPRLVPLGAAAQGFDKTLLFKKSKMTFSK
jgi:hypothetical protein